MAKSYLFAATSLHIFVVTNFCNSQCLYCQAESGSFNNKKMMTRDTAEKAVRIALQSPQNILDFEFQGGEPLSNYEIIKHIILYTEAHKGNKIVHFNLVSNLTLMNEEMMDFFCEHKVSISTSIDGDKVVHDYNRPLPSKKSAYDIQKNKIDELKRRQIPCSAIETTTRKTLYRYCELVDTYVSLGLDTVFIRPLTPLGNAKTAWSRIGYQAEEFLEFYEYSLKYIIELNKKGIFVREGHANIFLTKILKGYGMNYMELRSPCGAAVGQMAYYYDGNVFTCDEARMLHEMGDSTFCIGNVEEQSYDRLMESPVSKTVCKFSVVESLPGCTDCPYQAYCGVCPVINYAMDSDVICRQVHAWRCTIYKGILDILFGLLKYDDNRELFLKWVN